MPYGNKLKSSGMPASLPDSELEEFMKVIYSRLCVGHFEISVALLLIISGIADFLGWGQQDRTLTVLPVWEINLVNTLAITAGVFVTTGVMFNLRKLELSGMLILIATFTVRLLLYAVYLGINWNFVITGVFYTAVLWAAGIRTFSLIKGTGVVLVKADGESHGFRL